MNKSYHKVQPKLYQSKVTNRNKLTIQIFFRIMISTIIRELAKAQSDYLKTNNINI